MLSRVFGMLVVVAIVIGSVMYKVEVINKKNARNEITIASIHQEKGLPVYVDRVRYSSLPKSIKPTIKILAGGKVSILVPADTRSVVEKMKNAAVYIEDKKYIAYDGTLSPRSMDYTGFIEVIAKMKPALPWPVGTIKVGRAPFDFDQKYAQVPIEAIYRGNNGVVVYVVRDEKIHILPVDVTFSTNQFAAINESDVKVGDMVVVSDQRDLTEGEKAHVIERN